MRTSHVSFSLVGLILTVFALSAGAAPGRATLPGSVPSWAKSQNYAGPADASDSVGFRVYLGWKNPDAVLSLAQAVSNPRSTSYRHYLTPAQFRQQFAPSQADIVDPPSTVAVVRTNYNNSVDVSGGLSYRLRTMNQTLSLKTTSGYDDVTGLGTPAPAFLGSVCH